MAVAGYQIFRNGTSIGVTNSVSFSDTGLAPGTTYSYTVAAFDAAGNVSTLTAAVSATTTSTPINHPPVLLSPGNKTIQVGTVLSFKLSASDPDNDPLTFSSSKLPNNASLNTLTGAFSWKPNKNQVGVYTITFTVSDGKLTASQTITITVVKK